MTGPFVPAKRALLVHGDVLKVADCNGAWMYVQVEREPTATEPRCMARATDGSAIWIHPEDRVVTPGSFEAPVWKEEFRRELRKAIGGAA